MLLSWDPCERISLHHCNTASACVIVDDKSEKMPKRKFAVHFNTSKPEISLNHIEKLSSYLPTYPPTYTHIHLSTHLPTHPPTYPSTHTPTYLHTYLPIHLPTQHTYLPTYPHTYLPTCLRLYSPLLGVVSFFSFLIF